MRLRRHPWLHRLPRTGAKLRLDRRWTCVVPRQCSHRCHANVGGARSGFRRPFGLWHAPCPGTFSRELKRFGSFANNAGVTLEHHSPDICHARAVFEQDAHVRIAFDVGNFACPVSHAHDDVAAKAKVSQGYRVRKSILVDGAQYRPGRAAIEIRLNFFVAEFPWHESRLTRAKSLLVACAAVRQSPASAGEHLAAGRPIHFAFRWRSFSLCAMGQHRRRV